MGYMDVGGVRYFDVREINNIYFPITPLHQFALDSDASKRKDSTTLRSGNIDEAQKVKEQMEEAQRHDRKVREECETRRQKGGKKFAKIF